MNFVVGILIGFLAGWIIEWVIDWLFWRRDGQESELQEKLRRAEAEVGQLRTQVDENQAVIADAELTIEELRKQLDELTRRAPQREDRLEQVRGIGAVFAGKLKAAGIHTFAQLAELTPERVMQIIRPKEWQKIEAEDWIVEARELAEQQAAKAAS
jgi:predicted flap endonuclease-1-like 5' DNA nuclease